MTSPRYDSGGVVTIPEGSFGVRGNGEAMISWIEVVLVSLSQQFGTHMPLPAPDHIFRSTDGTRLWLYTDPSPEIVIEESVDGLDILPAGYTVIL